MAADKRYKKLEKITDAFKEAKRFENLDGLNSPFNLELPGLEY
jgi:hypothetical protein